MTKPSTEDTILAILWHHGEVLAGILSMAVQTLHPGETVRSVADALNLMEAMGAVERLGDRAIRTYRLTLDRVCAGQRDPAPDDPVAEVWEKIAGGA